jgi:quercetin dioxygenase-like cupin family protein
MRLRISGYVAGALVLLVALGVASANAQSTPNPSWGVVHELMRQPLKSQPGTDVVLISVDYPPGGATPPHDHPGYAYVYVLQGKVISQVEGQKPQTFARGQTWSELPYQHHLVSRNASRTAPAKLLVFLIVPHGEPLVHYLAKK